MIASPNYRISYSTRFVVDWGDLHCLTFACASLQSALVPIGMFAFGLVSAFSGQQLYPDVLITVQNVFFTGTALGASYNCY